MSANQGVRLKDGEGEEEWKEEEVTSCNSRSY